MNDPTKKTSIIYAGSWAFKSLFRIKNAEPEDTGDKTMEIATSSG